MRVFFDESISVYRLNTKVGGKVEEYVFHGKIMGAIKPAKAEDVMMSEGVPYETFKLYCENYSDIKEGDKLLPDFEYNELYNQNIESNYILDESGDNLVLSVSPEYIVKTVRRYSLKNIQRVECYLTLLKQ